MVQNPKNLIVISDAGRDIDDEFAFVSIAAANHLQQIKLRAVVANLKPALERARLIKGMLKELGLPDVPVAVGSAVKPDIKVTEFETMAAYKASAAELHQLGGQHLLRRTFTLSAEKSITLLLISGFTDAQEFIHNNPLLAASRIANVAIMGGVLTNAAGMPVLDKNSHVQPDDSYNNECDKPAAAKLYSQLQRLNIPTTMICRHAVYPVAQEHSFFDDVLAGGSIIGKRIQKRHMEYIGDFWRMVNLSPDHPDRVDFPSRMTREWFLAQFTHNTAETINALNSGAAVYDHVKQVNLYDVLAFMAALSPNDEMFKPHRQGNNVQIIGLNEKDHGIVDPQKVRESMREMIMQGLSSPGKALART